MLLGNVLLGNVLLDNVLLGNGLFGIVSSAFVGANVLGVGERGRTGEGEGAVPRRVSERGGTSILSGAWPSGCRRGRVDAAVLSTFVRVRTDERSLRLRGVAEWVLVGCVKEPWLRRAPPAEGGRADGEREGRVDDI